MPIRIVQPGDLITSSVWNDLAAAVINLEARVASLEKGGDRALRITQVLPPGTVTAGDTIRISGSGFDYTKGAHSVFFGSARAVSFAPDSSDTLLVVRVPDVVPGATPTGTAITMTVGNLSEYVTWPLTIRSKPEVISGGVQLTYMGSRPEAPTQDEDVFYNFQLSSSASRDLEVTITPTIQVVPPLPGGVSDPGLPGLLAVLDADGSVRSDRRIALPEGGSKTIMLRLRLPDGINGLRYSMSVVASASGVAPVVESLPTQEVGQQGEQPDATVERFDTPIVEGQGSFSTDTGGVSGVDGTLTIQRGSTVTVRVPAHFTFAAGTTHNYQLSGTIDSPANGWSAVVSADMQNPLPVVGPGGLVRIKFDITAPNSTATAVARLTLTRQGATTGNKRSVAYRLVTRT